MSEGKKTEACRKSVGSIVLRPLTFDDISAAADLERRCCSELPWDENALLTWLWREDAVLIAAEDTASAPENAPHIIGFAGIVTAGTDADILDITVDADFRRMGVGEQLLLALLREGAARGAASVHLEVRAGNIPAIHLYEKTGFRTAGIRKHYYQDPTEDALVMNLTLM